MGLSTNTYVYSGGAQTFPVSFALGFLNREDVTVYVEGELDGMGDQVYRTFTWNSDSEIVVTDNIDETTGDKNVTVQRTVEKDELVVDFDEEGTATRRNIQFGITQAMMAVHEFIDGRVDALEDVYPFSDYIEEITDYYTLAVSASSDIEDDLAAAISAASDAAASETASAASAVAAAASQVAAAASAAAAAASETAAGTSATNAASSESAAATSASAAATSEANAGTSETNAAASETAAAAAQTAAEAAAASIDPDDLVLKDGDTDVGGFTVKTEDYGEVTSGSTTPIPSSGNMKLYENGGAATINAPTVAGNYTIIVKVTNNASAGALTLSGFDGVSGADLTTTDGDKFFLYITKLDGDVGLVIQALQ